LTSAIEETSPVTSTNSAFGAFFFKSSITGSPRAAERAWTNTFQPRRPNSNAPALPMPVDAPVINITFFAIPISFDAVMCARLGFYVIDKSFSKCLIGL
jgi:hypothetical protein